MESTISSFLPNCFKEEEEQDPPPIFVKISKPEDLQEFLGKVVAMKSSSEYVAAENIVFAHISAYVHDWGYNEFGAFATRLITERDTPRQCAIPYCNLSKMDFQVRHITTLEKKFIINAVKKGSHTFEYLYNIPESYPINPDYKPPTETVVYNKSYGRVVLTPFELYPKCLDCSPNPPTKTV